MGVLLSVLLAISTPAEPLRQQVGPLTLVADPELHAELSQLGDEASRILPELARSLGTRPAAPFVIYLIPPGGPRDRSLRQLDAAAPTWASGYVFAEARVGAVRLGLADRYPYSDAGSVLAHEIVHVLLWDAGGSRLPRWFEEGVASHEALRWGWRDRWVLTSSVFTGVPPPLSRLDLEFSTSPGAARRAYAISFDFVGWAVREHGDDLVPRLLAEISDRGFSGAWKAVTGEALAESEARWRRGVTWLYRWVPILTASSTLWIAITALALLAGWRRRARTRDLEEAWRAEERPMLIPLDEPPESDDELVN